MGGKYIVKEGDNLWEIARRFNTSVKDLRDVNNLNSNELNIGDVLIIPQGKREKEVERAKSGVIKGKEEVKSAKKDEGQSEAETVSSGVAPEIQKPKKEETVQEKGQEGKGTVAEQLEKA